MNVPNIEKKAFRDMTAEERSVIVEAKLQGKVDCLNPDVEKWFPAESGYIRLATAYRTRQRKLEIPWEHIKPEFKWAAMDEDGTLYIYDSMPEMFEGYWYCDEAEFVCINDALIINTSGIDWRESLTQRPED